MVVILGDGLEGTVLKHLGKCISNVSDWRAGFVIFAIFESYLHYYLISFL